MLERIGDNAYRLELPADMNVSATFNVHDITLYMEDDFEHLRANSSQEGRLMHEKTPNPPLVTTSSLPKSKLILLG